MKDITVRIIEIRKALNPEEAKIQDEIKEKLDIDVRIDDYDKLKEVAEILLKIGLPLKHIKDNPALEVIDVDPSEDFYCKHNRETNTITLSEQLFSPEFRKKQPHHRIKHVPSLVELLTHEVGHAVNGRLDGITNDEFEKEFGWAITQKPKVQKKLKTKDYMSSLDAFLNVPKEKLTTIDEEEKKRIAEKIRKEGNYQKPDKQMKISWYGLTGPREDWAESYVNYVLNSKEFAKQEPERYDFMKKYVFGDKEYPSYSIRKSINKIKEKLEDPEIKTVLYSDSDLDNPSVALPGSKEELKHKRTMAKKVWKVRKALKGVCNV